jgi:O-antigen/teichoic acid export membrane protein
MLAVFIGLGSSFISSGLTQSLIRTSDPTEKDYTSVFYFNIVMGGLMYLLLFMGAPWIAQFYEQPILAEMIRVYGLIFIVQSFGMVQMAQLTKDMRFRVQLVISLPSLILGSAVGIVMAYNNYGVWSLVWSGLSQTVASNLQLWFYSKWRPTNQFDWRTLKKHWKYGYKLLLSGVLNTVFSNIYAILIGKFFLPAQVGFYQRADSLKQLPIANISNALNRVTFPLFAKIQDDNERLKAAYKKILQMVVYLVAPILLFMAALGEPLFRFLFTDKWLPAVPYFQILCLHGILYPIHAYNLNILTVKGLSGLFLKLEVIKVLIITITIGFSFQFGIYGLLIGSVFHSIAALAVNTHYSGRLIQYNFFQQVKDILPTLIIAFGCGYGVYFVDQYVTHSLHDFWRLSIGGSLGSFSYFILTLFFKFDALHELKSILFKK